MIQFNPDGSLKLPYDTIRKKQQDEERMRKGRCIHIIKEMVNDTPPKKCVLHIRLSDALVDNRFVETTYNYFKEQSVAPTRFIKLNDKEFNIEIGTDFKRCTDCCNLVNRYREFLDDNIIEKKQGCAFEGFRRSFSYEDYFE